MLMMRRRRRSLRWAARGCCGVPSRRGSWRRRRCTGTRSIPHSTSTGSQTPHGRGGARSWSRGSPPREGGGQFARPAHTGCPLPGAELAAWHHRPPSALCRSLLAEAPRAQRRPPICQSTWPSVRVFPHKKEKQKQKKPTRNGGEPTHARAPQKRRAPVSQRAAAVLRKRARQVLCSGQRPFLNPSLASHPALVQR